jgi:hypothetical protein
MNAIYRVRSILKHQRKRKEKDKYVKYAFYNSKLIHDSWLHMCRFILFFLSSFFSSYISIHVRVNFDITFYENTTSSIFKYLFFDFFTLNLIILFFKKYIKIKYIFTSHYLVDYIIVNIHNNYTFCFE